MAELKQVHRVKCEGKEYRYMLLQELGAPLGSEKHDFDYSIREIVEIGK